MEITLLTEDVVLVIAADRAPLSLASQLSAPHTSSLFCITISATYYLPIYCCFFRFFLLHNIISYDFLLCKIGYRIKRSFTPLKNLGKITLRGYNSYSFLLHRRDPPGFSPPGQELAGIQEELPAVIRIVRFAGIGHEGGQQVHGVEEGFPLLLRDAAFDHPVGIVLRAVFRVDGHVYALILEQEERQVLVRVKIGEMVIRRRVPRDLDAVPGLHVPAPLFSFFICFFRMPVLLHHLSGIGVPVLPLPAAGQPQDAVRVRFDVHGHPDPAAQGDQALRDAAEPDPVLFPVPRLFVRLFALVDQARSFRYAAFLPQAAAFAGTAASAGSASSCRCLRQA